MEIMLQKLDHSGIAVMSVGTFVPTIMLLFPRWEGILFILLSLGTCAWATAGIVHNVWDYMRWSLDMPAPAATETLLK